MKTIQYHQSPNNIIFSIINWPFKYLSAVTKYADISSNIDIDFMTVCDGGDEEKKSETDPEEEGTDNCYHSITTHTYVQGRGVRICRI